MNRSQPTTPSSEGPTGLPLSRAAAGQHVRVRALGNDQAVVRRLADLGLTIGSAATVVQATSANVILAARGTRLALGRSLADDITVTLEAEASDS